MRRALCLVFVAALSALSADDFSAAQTPSMPGSSTSGTSNPGASAPGVPGPGIPGPGTSPSTSVAQTLPAGRSVWTSSDGSTVDLTIDATTGAVTGTFAPGFPCGSSTSQTGRPVTGVSTGNALAFTLSLTDCPSVGTWIGHYQTLGTEQQLAVLFTLAMPDSPPGVGSTFTGSAIFVRQP
jgi:hypothetical protein